MATSMDENFHHTWGIPSGLNPKGHILNSPSITTLKNGTAPLQKPSIKHYSTLSDKINPVEISKPTVEKIVTDKKTDDLVEYLRKPDSLITRDAERNLSNISRLPSKVRTSLTDSCTNELSKIDTTLFKGSSMFEPHLIRNQRRVDAPKLLPNNAVLNLNILGKPLPGYDIGPLREQEHPEYSIDAEEDCEKKCLAILCSELTGGELPPFKKELELSEKAEMVHWYDYALHKLFGIDRCGYFALKAEKKWYQLHPWALLDQNSGCRSFDSDDASFESRMKDIEPGDETFHDFMNGTNSDSISLDGYFS